MNDSDTIEIQSMAEVPDFASDEEEHEYWRTHSIGDGVSVTPRELSDQPLPAARQHTVESKRISLTLEQDTLKRLKRLARKKGMGYQTLLKSFVGERLYEEERREGLLG